MRTVAPLLRKLLREQRWSLSFGALMLFLFVALGTYLYTTFGDMNQIVLDRVSPQLVAGFLGGLAGGASPLETWLITLFVHPMVFTVFSVVVVAVSSRSLAGEIDRGTVDVLLACPVPRWALVLSSVIFLELAVTGLTLVCLAAMWTGLSVGEIEAPQSLHRFLLVGLSLW